MNSPEEYICAMALTLEQANLDFALEYAERFQNVGDERSAKILNCVYQDELFHVRVGVEWMERWKKPEESQWDFHVRHLHFPLSPARAKSANLSVQARLDCGLTLDYIDSLSQFQRSKGRPPDVFFYNGLGETELTTPGALPNSRLELEADLESAMSLLACDDDVQIVRRHWSKHFKEQLKSTGRSVPETILLGEEIPHRLIGSFKPWMWTPVLRKNFRALGPRQTRTVLPEYLNAKTTLPIELLSSKSKQRALEAQLPAHSLFRAPLQQVVTSEDQLRNVLKDPNYATAWVLKSPLGCSGHGLRLGQGLDEIPWPWIKKTLAQQHQLIIEEQCQRWADYSLLGEMIEGQVRWLGHTRMLIDRRGVYKGALFGDDWRGFGDQHHRRLFCDGQPFLKTLQDQLSPILETWFAEHNFQGNFGVDCFIYKKDQQLYVRPLSEVNVRTTFGHLALQLQKRIKHGRTGIMFFCPQKYWDNLRQLNMECENGLWVNGIVACNDVWLAQQLGVFCWVGESCEQLLTEGNEAIKGEFSPILHHLVDAVF